MKIATIYIIYADKYVLIRAVETEMITDDLEKAIGRQAEQELITKITELLSNFATGMKSSLSNNLSVDSVVKVYREERIRMDRALEKYINNDDVFHVSERGGFQLSEEHKRKISQSCKGRRMSDEEKERHRKNAQRREVYQYDAEGHLIAAWASTREAGRAGYNSSFISQVCRNGKKAYGCYWKYKPLDEGNDEVKIETATTITTKR